MFEDMFVVVHFQGSLVLLLSKVVVELNLSRLLQEDA